MKETLERGLPQLGMGVDLIPRLAAFAELVLERNQVMNLTAITEPKDVAALHLLDSLSLIKPAGLENSLKPGANSLTQPSAEPLPLCRCCASSVFLW